VAGDGTISFKLTSLDQYVRYGSRESDNPPVLVVETNTAARSDSLQQSFATLMRNLAAVSESIIQYLRAAVESVW
jgi:hypothetical protein